ncbi:MAG: zinc ribbon domain-containing protein [Methylobacter sp.]|nr:zinc ribbon domain-containing protein [Methylobacter sp.]
MLENQSSPAFSCRKSIQYLIAIIITLIVAELLESIPLFSHTFLFRGLTSAELINFAAKIIVLALFFVFTQYAINSLKGSGSGVAFIQGLALPVAALIIVIVAHESVEQILSPFLRSTGRAILTLISSFVVLAAGIWVILAGYQYSTRLFDWFIALRQKIRPQYPDNHMGKTCPACAAHVDNAEKYCPACGNELDIRQCKNRHAEMTPSANFCGQCGQPKESS